MVDQRSICGASDLRLEVEGDGLKCEAQPNLRSQLGHRGSASLVEAEHHGHGRSPSAARSRTETGDAADSHVLTMVVLLMRRHDRSATAPIGGFRELTATSLATGRSIPCGLTQAMAELRSVIR